MRQGFSPIQPEFTPMKTGILSSPFFRTKAVLPSRAFVLLFVFALSPLFAADDFSPLIAFPKSQDYPGAPPYIQRGMKHKEVYRLAQTPFERITPDIWAFRGFKSNDEVANRQGFDTLVVFFHEDRVIDMKLVSWRTLKELVAQRKSELKRAGYARN